MKNKIFKILFFFMLIFFFPLISNATINYTFPSGTYHVVWIKYNGTSTTCGNGVTIDYDSNNIEYIKSYNTYDEALTYMNTLTSTDSKVASIIGQKKDKTGAYSNAILNSQYAIVDLNTTGTSITNTYVYTSATNNTYYTYLNGYGDYGATDAALIDYNNGTNRANIKISGVTGWINSLISSAYTGYDIVPISVANSVSYYYVNDSGELVHKYTKKISGSGCNFYERIIGPAPNSLTAKDTSNNFIHYYSYDGNYFYTSMIKMLDDYKNGANAGAVNTIPYYNYYMFLPIRSMSNMTATDISKFFDSRNITSSSALYGQENAWITSQSNYGINAAISLSIAINESGWGNSTIAKTKNNIYGIAAYDENVDNATAFASVGDCINRFSYHFISSLYSEPKTVGDYYHGGHVGNKNSGINVKYAADPYWGEKMASYYYSLDNFNDFKDLNYYSIGIKTSLDNVDVKKDPSTTSKTIYTLKSTTFSISDMPSIILERVTGESINGNDIWYKILSEGMLDETRENIIQDAVSSDRYDWNNSYGYIHSSNLILMGENVNKIYIKKTGLFGLENLSLDNTTKKVNISGYLAITGMNNDKTKTITYDVVLQNQKTNKTYELPLNRITDLAKIPFVVTYDNYDYTYSWFNGTIDLSSVPEGDYTTYVRARSGEFESKEILSNILSRNSISNFTDSNGRGYKFRTNYYLKTIPLELFIRDKGLITNSNSKTYDNMINQYHEVALVDGKLNISGSSFNIGGNYATSQNITRKIILENINTFERYEYDLGYIDNGPYQITLIVPDGLDKTRAWFNNSIDISTLPKGEYAIYIKTISNIEDYDELNDIFSRSITSSMSYNSKNYSLSVNENGRFRIELLVK